jgi:ERCC4-type nuclease
VIPLGAEEGSADRYVVSPRLAVERRTGSGFLQGIRDKSLFTNAVYLSENFAIPILIVEGKADYTYSRFRPKAVLGALTSMVIEYGLGVLSTADIEETADLIAMLCRQEQEGIPEISLIPKRKAVGLPDRQRRVAEMLPHSGRVVARELLQRFGRIDRIASASEAELCKVPGIGPQSARDIYRVLHGEYESVDTEKNLEDAIQRSPDLLFDFPVELLARQHLIHSRGEEKLVIDMVFVSRSEKGGKGSDRTVFLVELKRGILEPDHYHQLCRYMDQAHRSALIRNLLDEGVKLKGVLATVEECALETARKDISFRIVDKAKAIEVLKEMRKINLGGESPVRPRIEPE